MKFKGNVVRNIVRDFNSHDNVLFNVLIIIIEIAKRRVQSCQIYKSNAENKDLSN